MSFKELRTASSKEAERVRASGNRADEATDMMFSHVTYLRGRAGDAFWKSFRKRNYESQRYPDVVAPEFADRMDTF